MWLSSGGGGPAEERRLAGGEFDYEDLGVLELKGIAGPVRAASVLGVSKAASRFDAAAQEFRRRRAHRGVGLVRVGIRKKRERGAVRPSPSETRHP